MTDKLTAKSFELSSSEIALVYTEKKVTLHVLGKPKWLMLKMLTYTGSSPRMIKGGGQKETGLMSGTIVKQIGKLGTCLMKSTLVVVEDLRFTMYQYL